MLTKNAIGNLINRYKAVLKKCHLLNTFGTLAIVGALTLGAGLAHVEYALAASLSDINDTLDKEDESRTAGDLGPHSVTLSHITEAPGITESTIAFGAKLTLTGKSSTTLVADSIENKGKLILGTGITGTGTIGGSLTNSSAGEITVSSNLNVLHDLKLNGTEANFNNGLTVTGTTTISGGTNKFNGNTNFNGMYTGSGSASFSGETTFNGAYTNTGTSTIIGQATFNGGYSSTGGLIVGDTTTGASGDVTISGGSMTIGAGGTLDIASGTVDVSNGNLIVDGGAATFKTGVDGVLKAKAEDFATFANTGGDITVDKLLQGNVGKMLANAGSLILTGQSGSMHYAEYEKLLDTASGLITGGTLQLEGVSISTANVHLEDIKSGTDLPNNVVLGDDTASEGTFASGRTAIIGGVNGNMNNLGTLTLTGKANNVLVNGSSTNNAGGVLNLQNGGITGTLTNNGTVNINGATVVEGDLTNGSNLNVQSGSFTAKGGITLNGGTLRTTNANAGNDINGATATFLHNLPNGIDGHIISAQNSYTVLGAGDSNYAINAFSTSNQDWGTNATAALFITSPQELKNTGRITVNGSKTNIPAAELAVNNEVKFAANSMLVVDAVGLNGGVALTANGGILTVESGAKLHIANAVSGTTVHIVSGFDDAAGVSDIADKAWEGDNLTTSTGLQSAQVADFNPTVGTYSIKITGSAADQIQKDFPAMQGGTANLMAELAKVYNVNSQEESIRFFSILMDDTLGIGKKNPTEVTKITESILQIAQTGAASGMSMGASFTAANNIIAYLSQSGFNLVSSGGQGPQSVQVSEAGPSGQGGLSAGSANSSSIKNGMALWVAPMYKYSSVAGVSVGAFEHGYNSSLGGLSLGGDYTIDSTFRVGLAFNLGTGYAESTGDLSKTHNNFDFWGLSLYGAYYKENFSLMADMGFNSTQGSFTQEIPMVGGISSFEANTQSITWTAGLTAEYTFNTSFMDITPHAGIRYMHVHTGAYDTENHLGAVSHTESDSQSIWYFPVGVTFSKDFASESNWTFTPRVDLGFIAAAGDLHSTSVSSMLGVSGSSEYSMQNVDGFAFNGGLGFDLANADNGVTISLNYNLQASKHETGHMLSAMFRYDF